MREFARPMLALYVGGMGAKGRNFYNDLVCRYGFEKEAEQIQDLYLDGKKDEAAALIPDELLEKTTLCGPEGYVKERIAAFKESGCTVLNVTPARRPHGDARAGRHQDHRSPEVLEQLRPAGADLPFYQALAWSRITPCTWGHTEVALGVPGGHPRLAARRGERGARDERLDQRSKPEPRRARTARDRYGGSTCGGVGVSSPASAS